MFASCLPARSLCNGEAVIQCLVEHCRVVQVQVVPCAWHLNQAEALGNTTQRSWHIWVRHPIVVTE